MPNPLPNSRLQIVETLTDRHVVPVQDVDRPDLTNLAARATAFGIAAGVGAPTAYAAAVAATYTHNSAAANADLTFTAVVAGAYGNNYSVEVLQPVTLNAVLSVDWDGSKITVNLPTDGAGAPVAATGLEVKTAFDLTDAAGVVSCAIEGDGSGAVDALAEQSLASGADKVAGSGPAYLYVDTSTPGLYINTGTLDEPAWTAA